MSKEAESKMGLNATWSMAVGGMIGGGIFAVLGLIISIAGNMAWLSFLLAGLIALATARSYANLTNKFEEGGGAFTYIKEINHEGLAGGLSWLLIIGYILTLSVYAFTFGHYLANLVGMNLWLPRLASVLIILFFVYFNLKGTGQASWIEIITVWGKLIILLGIAGFGIWNFEPELLQTKSQATPFMNALIGAATIFMAYEGFQLITYDYNDIKEPEKTIKQAEILAVISVILVYIIVTIGIVILVGHKTIIAEKEVVIAIAGKKAMGMFGLILATIGALFSTGSAINSTIFATSRLANKVANDGELPELIAQKNDKGIPHKAVIIIGGLSAILAAIGSLANLVEAASFIFLLTFGIVNLTAYAEVKSDKLIAIFGAVGSLISSIVLLWRFINRSPIVIFFLLILLSSVSIGRYYLYKHR